MEKQAKIVQIREMLMQDQKPSDLLDNWFSMHSVNEGYFYLILHAMTRLSVTRGDLDAVNEFLSKYYHEDICYTFMFGNYNYTLDDLKAWLTSEKTKLVAYFPMNKKLVFYDKTLNTIKELPDLKHAMYV